MSLQNTRLLNITDQSLVLDLFERCRAYFEDIEGRTPTMEVAQELLTQLPPGKREEDKEVFGFFDEQGKLAAFVDLVRDYPVEKEWIIGLMLVAPENRGRGMAQRVHAQIAGYAATNGAEMLRVAVLEINGPGRRFWESMGYFELKRVPYPRGDEEVTAIVMNRKMNASGQV